MERSSVAKSAKLRYSLGGKLDVVRGAMSDRRMLTEKFVRKSETLKSYGTLMLIDYNPGSGGRRMFPNAFQDGAVPLERVERQHGVELLKVVQWSISKVSFHKSLGDSVC
jgi:hypothetical protein